MIFILFVFRDRFDYEDVLVKVRSLRVEQP